MKSIYLLRRTVALKQVPERTSGPLRIKPQPRATPGPGADRPRLPGALGKDRKAAESESLVDQRPFGICRSKPRCPTSNCCKVPNPKWLAAEKSRCDVHLKNTKCRGQWLPWKKACVLTRAVVFGGGHPFWSLFFAVAVLGLIPPNKSVAPTEAPCKLE